MIFIYNDEYSKVHVSPEMATDMAIQAICDKL